MSDVFRRVDTDCDGQISYAEFLSGASDQTKLINKENLQFAFRMLDLNNDGTISIDEVRQRFSQSRVEECQVPGLQVGEAFWLKLITEFDTDNDGEIDF